MAGEACVVSGGALDEEFLKRRRKLCETIVVPPGCLLDGVLQGGGLSDGVDMWTRGVMLSLAGSPVSTCNVSLQRHEMLNSETPGKQHATGATGRQRLGM